MRRMRGVLVSVLDGLLLFGTAVVLAISLSGGTTLTIAGRFVSAHSTGWAIVTLSALVLLRLRAGGARPFLGFLNLTGDHASVSARLQSAWTRFLALDDRSAQ